MNYREMRDFLFALQRERQMLHWDLEDSEGEVTESVMTREEKIAQLRAIFKSEGGIDAVGRYVKMGQDMIQARKDEKAYAEKHLKIEEDQQAIFLELVNEALEEEDLEKVKGDYGYSFSQHISTTTKVDSKLLKEKFYDKVERLIRTSGIVPEDVTFSLSASVSKLPEGADRPEWYNTVSVGKATFRKPKKADDEEFKINDFDL